MKTQGRLLLRLPTSSQSTDLYQQISSGNGVNQHKCAATCRTAGRNLHWWLPTGLAVNFTTAMKTKVIQHRHVFLFTDIRSLVRLGHFLCGLDNNTGLRLWMKVQPKIGSTTWRRLCKSWQKKEKSERVVLEEGGFCSSVSQRSPGSVMTTVSEKPEKLKTLSNGKRWSSSSFSNLYWLRKLYNFGDWTLKKAYHFPWKHFWGWKYVYIGSHPHKVLWCSCLDLVVKDQFQMYEFPDVNDRRLQKVEQCPVHALE